MGIVFGVIGVERPAFEVLETFQEYDVRHFTQEMVKAEISSSDFGGKKEFDKRGFGVLAKYIGVFGNPNNEGKTAIAMTAPVVTQGSNGDGGKPTPIAMTAPVVTQADTKAGGDHETMAFILPAEFTMETAPTPTDSKVKLLSVPSSTCAVRQFTWGCTMETAEKRKDELVEWIEKDGSWEVDGEWVLNRYNPPFTISFLRTNEIQIPVKRKDGSAAATESRKKVELLSTL